MLHVIVDGANVVGSRPDGWWRDRPGAARRLAGRLAAALTVDPARLADGLGHPGADLQLHLVLEGAAAGVEDLPTHPRLAVVRAEADGDTAIAALAADLVAEAQVLVVTADRALREQVRDAGATTLGPGTFLNALPAL
ncbi:hypothetical protein FHX44_117006 [Pseudonocardia hierapolitana]|uniref:YacP-like NYN domain-containing protein n=1 Tax=Pseudonocardia hierapolitana TaxID=1128676 RepID=A0A561T1S2_9PSEU|nr:hypothetical protein [Pseudonocardia hierapolitana]TWF81063.1 hypothetical protein FHX44_117006 [Pseudonocardia hierapolitana]